jgi:3-hydroxy-3-methylglutaryl CoA synthase
MIGITAYGAYIPRIRLQRQAVVRANSWYAPHLMQRQGTRSLANWDEDSITMAVAAARDCFGKGGVRAAVRSLYLASTTHPFDDRSNAGVVASALALGDAVDAMDVSGTQRAGLGALSAALDACAGQRAPVLVAAADSRKTRAGSVQELDYGDGAAALLVGTEGVLAEHLGSVAYSVDFIDHFRAAGVDVDYHWEERWVRDEGLDRWLPKAIGDALVKAQVAPGRVDHLVCPNVSGAAAKALCQACGLVQAAVADNLSQGVGDTGTPHSLLVLADVLARAQPGQVVVVAQFAFGARALVFRVTEAIRSFRPARGVQGWLQRGVEEGHYTKMLAFKNRLDMERGMRGEQDKKTALSTAWRHRASLSALVGGRCRVSGQVVYPPSRLTTTPEGVLQDTQDPYPLADRPAQVMSWSAEYLSWHPAPPHHYGQVDFEGGGRILMDFTDLDVGDVDVGTAMEMVFRIKDIDERRGFVRYFWKATPVRAGAEPS